MEFPEIPVTEPKGQVITKSAGEPGHEVQRVVRAEWPPMGPAQDPELGEADGPLPVTSDPGCPRTLDLQPLAGPPTHQSHLPPSASELN